MIDFAKLEKTDVTKHIEQKNKFSYLSWPFAVSEFRKHCPNGTWEFRRMPSGSPVLTTDFGNFVEVIVTPDLNEKELQFSQIHPILDHSNRPIQSPNSFQVNTSCQRALVKAIAIATGIGLHIYQGEDLPPSDTQPPASTSPPDKPKKLKKEELPPADQAVVQVVEEVFAQHDAAQADAEIVSAYDDFKAQIDAIDNKFHLTNWAKKHSSDMSRDLNGEELDKLREYYRTKLSAMEA